MKCPGCGGGLVVGTREGVAVQECPLCGGAWFQRQELRRAKDSADEDLRWMDFDVFSDEESFTGDMSERRCPQCTGAMDSRAYATSGVVIDCCPTDHGVWLDAGEFDKILEHLETVLARLDAGEYGKRALEELREVVTGPESRISELKDFLTVVRLLQYRLGVEHPGAVNALTALSRRL